MSLHLPTVSGRAGAQLLRPLLVILGEREVPLPRGLGQSPLGRELFARRLAVKEMNVRVHAEPPSPTGPKPCSIMKRGAAQALLSVRAKVENRS